MRLYVEANKLTNDHLRLLATKTGKSVKTLKRLKQAHTYLMYSSADHYYDFIGYSQYVSYHLHKSSEQFFKNIEQLELLRLLS